MFNSHSTESHKKLTENALCRSNFEEFNRKAKKIDREKVWTDHLGLTNIEMDATRVREPSQN